MDELRIVLLGKQGAGKSTSGNTLLCLPRFSAAASSERVTQTCSMSTSTVNKQMIKVIDTPGWCDSSQSETDIKQEIIKCIHVSRPGPHAFLLVLPIGRFTNEEINTIMDILKEFGDEVTKYMIVLFTKGDDLEGRPIEDYMKEVHSDLMKIIQICGGRYHVFNNRDKKKSQQVSSLVKKINEMVERNEEKYYTTAMYQKGKDQQHHDTKAVCEKKKTVGSEKRNGCDAGEEKRGGLSKERKEQEYLKLKNTQEKKLGDSDKDHGGLLEKEREEGKSCDADGNSFHVIFDSHAFVPFLCQRKVKMDELRIVLLGKQGAGKSASGNTLLCLPHFSAAASSERVTQTCSICTSTVNKQMMLEKKKEEVYQKRERSKSI